MNARQDKTLKRLKHDLATGTWLTDKMPKWHSKSSGGTRMRIVTSLLKRRD